MSTFKYSLNASTIRPTPILDKIQIAGRVGYGGIELWHDEIDQFLSGGGSLRDLRSALSDQGLAVPTTIYLKGWFDASEQDYVDILDACKRRMAQAAEIGAPFVIASPPAGTVDYDLGARRYRELLTIGDELGVMPVMEFLGFLEQFNRIEDALDIISRSGHPGATTVLDPFHIFRGNGSVDSISKLKAQQIAISHFNDVAAEPARTEQHDGDRVMPGDGVFDLQRYLQLLSQTGYQGWLSLELFREDLWQQDPTEVARIGLDKMRQVAEACES